MKEQTLKRRAYRFIIFLGVVSLFADVTYEGARSIIGPYLGILGASAMAVGFVAGLGEMLGYGLRLVSGYLADRLGHRWLLVLVGYAINLFAVPLLAFVGRWELAAGLIVMERLGKAIRTPARDTMLSFASHQVGRGWGFGLHEAMDQIGAIAGPLFLSAILFWRHDYQFAFLMLFIPAIFSFGSLLMARISFPTPQDLEMKSTSLKLDKFDRKYWWYLAAAGFTALGYADFPLIAFHVQKNAILNAAHIPLLYALAMGVDAVAALFLGGLFDRFGVVVLRSGLILAALFAPLAFSGQALFIALGMVLWGIGMGIQESILRAMIANLVPAEKRGTGYGLFHAVFGVMWFLGSTFMGYLYDVHLLFLILFSIISQVMAVFIMLKIKTEGS